jgi:HK97 family phage prohead protease
MYNKITKHQETIVKDVSGEKGIVTLQISRFNKYDSDGDRMLKGAFNKTFKEGKQVHLVDHKVGTSTFVGLPIKKDPENLIIESQLNLNKTVARELLSDYEFGLKHGRSLQHSQGFRAIKYKENEKGGDDFEEVDMREYSTVLFGAESNTPVHSIKNAEEANKYISLLEMRCKFGFLTDENGLEIEKLINKIKSLLQEPSKDTQTEKGQEAEKSLHKEQFKLLSNIKF